MVTSDLYVETYETSSEMNFIFPHAFYFHVCHCSLCVIFYKAATAKEKESLHVTRKEFPPVHNQFGQ